MTDYQPGVCNIGPAEQRKRSALGALASLATLLVVLAVLATDISRFVLLVTVVSLFVVAEGFLQAQTGFCPRFASTGVYDVSDDGTERRQVTDADDHATDRRRARRFHLQSAGLAIVGTGVVVAVGVLVP